MLHSRHSFARFVCVATITVVGLVGCTKPKETTAIGAATGGAIGAGLGAIIGNQTGDAGSGLAIGAVAGAATGSLLGNAIQAQQEAVRSQDEAIERQDRMIAAQRTEIAELRNLNPDVVEQKRLALQKRGPSPSTYGTRTYNNPSNAQSLSNRSSDPLARLNMRSQTVGERTITTTSMKSAPARKVEQPRRAAPPAPQIERKVEEPVVAKQVYQTSEAPESCGEAEKERSSAENAMESSDKLFHLRRALRLCPNNARVHHELGQVYASMDRKSDAEHEFKQALDVDPSYAPAKQSLDKISSDNIKF